MSNKYMNTMLFGEKYEGITEVCIVDEWGMFRIFAYQKGLI